MLAAARVAPVLLSAAVVCGATLSYANQSNWFRAAAASAEGAAAAQAGTEGRASAAELPGGAAVGRKSRAPDSAQPRRHAALMREPYARHAGTALPYEASALSARWAELLSRIRLETETLQACRSGAAPCPEAARRFLAIVELGSRREGRARLGEINRAVNLSIRAASDWSLYGVEDFWSAPLATLSMGAGDCEDYAIIKYVALQQAGVSLEDLRLVIVRDTRQRGNHAVVAARHDGEWLILDNRTLVMVNADAAPHYAPLLVLDDRGARPVGSLAFRR